MAGSELILAPPCLVYQTLNPHNIVQHFLDTNAQTKSERSPVTCCDSKNLFKQRQQAEYF